MADSEVERLRGRHARLLDSAFAGEPTQYVTVSTDVYSDQLQARLVAMFGREPQLAAIGLRAPGEELIGTVTRASVEGSAGTASAPGNLGAGDRAGLPGRSTQFRALVFACRTPGCGATAVRAFYDDRFLPACPSTAQPPHGTMELRR